jgi:hypothetical protein
VSSIFWALRAGVFSQKSTIAFKTRKITMGEHASAFFFVVAEFAVVRRPSSPPERDRSAQLLFNIKKMNKKNPPAGWGQQHERPAVVVCERYNITSIATYPPFGQMQFAVHLTQTHRHTNTSMC